MTLHELLKTKYEDYYISLEWRVYDHNYLKYIDDYESLQIDDNGEFYIVDEEYSFNGYLEELEKKDEEYGNIFLNIEISDCLIKSIESERMDKIWIRYNDYC